MTDLQTVRDTVAQISEKLKVSQADDNLRATLLQLSRSLVTSLESPDETIANLAFSSEYFLCVRIAEDLNIFRLLLEEQKTLSQLCNTTSAEEALLMRLMRTLTAMGYVVETEHHVYAPNATTRHLTTPNVAAGVRYMFDEHIRIFPDMVNYFKSRKYTEPKGTDDSPYQYAWKIDEDYYVHTSRRPEVAQTSNVFMQGLFGTARRLGWTDWFPLDKVCLDGFDDCKSPYAFVDIGSGKGHETELMLRKWPDARGMFIIQDQPHVLDSIASLDHRIKRVPINFMIEPPVKGARTYFMQNIMHNWATPICVKILSHIRQAMIPGNSKLLIGNVVIPDNDVPLRVTGLDLCMLVLSGGAQRDSGEWKSLVEAAGLRIAKIWSPSGDTDSIIEVHTVESRYD